MVWVLSLSDMDLSTHALTADHHFIAFGVCQELVGGETPASNQCSTSIKLNQRCTEMHFGDYELFPSLIGLSPLPTGHPKTFQRQRVRASTVCYYSFTLPMGRSHGFASTATN